MTKFLPRTSEPEPSGIAAAMPLGVRHAGWPRPFLYLLLKLSAALALLALLYFAFRRAPVRDIVSVLSQLRAWQLALLLVVDASIYVLVTARWWFVAKTENTTIRLLPMIAVRLSAFAVSYFTLGPQIGGEPLQVYYLRWRYGMTYTRATASVLLDKLFELLANFLLFSFGLLAVSESGLLAGTLAGSRPALAAVALLVSWPLIHVILLYHHQYPISWAWRFFFPARYQKKSFRFIRACEHIAGRFCRKYPRHMVGSLAASLLGALITVSEYAFMASFLHIGLPFWKLVTAWTSGWLSFLVPLPGALGALEASQVSVLGLFGVSAAAAVSLALLIRGRDMLIGAVGLVVAGAFAGRRTIRTLIQGRIPE